MKPPTCCMAALAGVLMAGSAATGQTLTTDFTRLPTDNPTLYVVDDSGKETKGRLLRFDATSLTLSVNKSERRFDRQQVNQIYARGDSLTNGMLIGLFTGVGLGVVAGATADWCGGWFFESARSCTGSEKASIAGVLSAVFGGIGLGFGAGIDALIRGRDVLYERNRLPGGAALSVAPTAGPHGAGVSVALRW